MSKPKAIAWLDVETPGLGKLQAPPLLEVALVVTGPDLHELSRESVVIYYEPAELARMTWDQTAWDMHEANGLRRACSSGEAVPLAVAQRRMIAALSRGLGRTPEELAAVGHAEGSSHEESPVWGGCSPHLDRLVIRAHMPELYAMIHYRTLDATALRLAFELWNGLSIGSTEGPKPHRALADTLRAIEITGAYRRLLNQAAEPELVRASA